MGGDEGGRETEDTGPSVSTLLRECGGQRFKGGYSDYSVTINYTVTLLAGQICQKANSRLPWNIKKKTIQIYFKSNGHFVFFWPFQFSHFTQN